MFEMKLYRPKYLLFYSPILVAAFLLKLFYHYSETSDLLWLLAPTTALLELYSGKNFVLEPEGYYLASKSILISKACSGLNFLIISLGVSALIFGPQVRSYLKALSYLALSFILCFLLSVFTNAARIQSLISCSQIYDSFFQGDLPSFFHQAIGVSVFLSSLIIYSLILSKLKDVTIK